MQTPTASTIERQALPVLMDAKGEPIAIIFFNKSRDRIIYTLTKADEDAIIELFQKQALDRPNPNETTNHGAGDLLFNAMPTLDGAGDLLFKESLYLSKIPKDMDNITINDVVFTAKEKANAFNSFPIKKTLSETVHGLIVLINKSFNMNIRVLYLEKENILSIESNKLIRVSESLTEANNVWLTN